MRANEFIDQLHEGPPNTSMAPRPVPTEPEDDETGWQQMMADPEAKAAFDKPSTVSNDNTMNGKTMRTSHTVSDAAGNQYSIDSDYDENDRVVKSTFRKTPRSV